MFDGHILSHFLVMKFELYICKYAFADVILCSIVCLLLISSNFETFSHAHEPKMDQYLPNYF